MWRCICVVAVVCGVAGVAQADFFTEVEPNSSIATAQDIGDIGFPGGSHTVDGTLIEGDVDWYRVDLLDMADLFFSVEFSSPPGSGDGQLMIVDFTGTDVIAFDDDDNVSLDPSISIANLAAGTYYVGVSAFPDVRTSDDPVGNDILFDGLDSTGAPHPENFGYKVIIGATIPAPASAGLIAMAGLLGLRRRR